MNGGRYRWSEAKDPEDEALKDLSEFLALLRQKHSLSVLTTAALLDLVRTHLNNHLLEEDSED